MRTDGDLHEPVFPRLRDILAVAALVPITYAITVPYLLAQHATLIDIGDPRGGREATAGNVQ